MPVLALRVILTVSFLMFPGISEAGEKKLNFTTPSSFLGSPGVSQIDYLSGFLDALYFVEKNGLPDSIVTRCLLHDADTSRTLSVLVITARNAVRDEIKGGNKDFSVIDALVARLKVICPKP